MCYSCICSNGCVFVYCYWGYQLSVGINKYIVVDNGFKFICIIVVVGNGFCVDVNVIVNFCIVQVSQMISF